jgi:hypothetical protein
MPCLLLTICRELTQRLLEVSSQHHKREVSSSRGGTWFPTGSESDLAAFVFPTAPLPAAAAGTAGALTVVSAGVSNAFFAGQQQPQQPGLAHHDDLSSLLEALAAVYRVRPGLWHDKEAPLAFPFVTTFMSHVSSSCANRMFAPRKHQWHCMPLCSNKHHILACSR